MYIIIAQYINPCNTWSLKSYSLDVGCNTNISLLVMNSFFLPGVSLNVTCIFHGMNSKLLSVTFVYGLLFCGICAPHILML